MGRILHHGTILVLSQLWFSAAFQPLLQLSSSVAHRRKLSTRSGTRLRSSFAADGSEYSSKDKDYADDEDFMSAASLETKARMAAGDDDDETPTVEMGPIPMSKNSGNRFLALLWDAELNQDKTLDEIALHDKHTDYTEDHVMYCRKANLYNETFNVDSMVDVLWSCPILSSDLVRVIGHAMCLESTHINHINDFLKEEPTCVALTDGETEKIPLYRWRHIRDYSLRIDDGRNGYPCMCIAMDGDPIEVGNTREETREANLEYLIKSERVIATGPLYMPTEMKDDPSCIPLGDLLMFNANDREHAIEFVQNLPSAQAGLYDDMRVQFYNSLDVTGKFVSEDPMRDAPCQDMKEALEVWGYPVHDDQTPHLNA